MAKDQKEDLQMNKYELAVVVNAKLADDARAETFDRVKGLIERFGGQITRVDDWGRKKLAYEIDKMTEGFYSFIHFESGAEAPAEIEKRIRIMDGVIRYLIVKDNGLEKPAESTEEPEKEEENE